MWRNLYRREYKQCFSKMERTQKFYQNVRANHLKNNFYHVLNWVI